MIKFKRAKVRPRPLKDVLFVCIENKLSSPTAKQVFSSYENLEVDSAGTHNDAINPLNNELIEWADIIFLMEKTHRSKVQGKYRSHLGGKRVICLDSPEEIEFMVPVLVNFLKPACRAT